MLRKMSFWTKVKACILFFGIGGEAFLYLEQAAGNYKALGIIATFLGLIITQFFQDANNNDIVDWMEKKKKKEEENKPE